MKYRRRKISLAGYYRPVVLTVVMLIMAVPGIAAAGGREYTIDADFDEGVLVGAEHDTVPENHDQLQLSEEKVTLPFIWVPNQNGTVSKVHTESGNELGRYRVVPPGLSENGSPSRTTVDLEGNCWVGNRAAGTVVKIGLYEAGQWIDRNGDSICQTSQDTNGDGDITGDEILPWGQDECVLYEVVLIPGSEGTYAPGTYALLPPPTWQPAGGVFGGALEFNGGGGYVDVGSVGISGNAPRTIAGWAKASTTNIPDWTTVFGFAHNGSGNNTYFDIEVDNSDNYVFHVYGWEPVLCPVDTDWHHFAATHDGGTASWYLDGNPVGSATRTLSTIDELKMGVRMSLDNHFPGLIDDVRIYDYALSQAEIGTVMNCEPVIWTRAWNPSPGNGAQNVPIDTTLSWMPGENAVLHDVYFGTNPTPGESEFKGNQTATTYDPGLLEWGTTYYWQVNEVEADGTVHQGNIWSFTTYACAGSYLYRAAYWDAQYPTVWTSGTSLRDDFEAAGYDILDADQLKAWMDARIVDGMPSVVVFCQDIAPDTVVESMSSTCTLRQYLDAGGKIVWYADIPMYYQGHSNGTRTTWGQGGSNSILGFNAAGGPWNSDSEVVFTPDGVDWGLTETWQSVRPTSGSGLRVLAEDAAGYPAAWVKHYVPGDTYRGFVRLFDRAGQPNFNDVLRVAEYSPPSPKPSNPNPKDGAGAVSIQSNLAWMAGDTATSHDVYFGTSSPPPSVSSNQTETTYDPGLLAGGTTYYWQIVEQPGGHAGAIWSFKTLRTGTGTILREVWEGIAGTSVSNLTGHTNYPDNPTFSDELTSFEAPTDWANYYGTRIHGYLHPETSGLYTFWIASDDASELWLSIDENPANAVPIANVPGWTTSREWDKYLEQQSASIPLVGGQKYYIMALYKEGGGGDNLAVAWQKSDWPTREVISGYYLSSYGPPVPPEPPGLVAHWKFDEESGFIASDSSGNGNDGTLMPCYDLSLYDNDSWSTSPRGLAIDADNNLWAGTWISSDTGYCKYYYIDGATGTILKTVDTSALGHNAYGAVIDKNGILWSSGQENNHVLRLDPSTEPPTISILNLGQFSYGIGLDYDDHLFVSAYSDYKLSRVDISTGLVDWTQDKSELIEARGVACTSDNDVWVACTAPGMVYRYDNDGNPIATIDVGSPTGVAVDAKGKVWSCNLNDEYITRIDPATNTVDLWKPIIGSGGHYSYSDMTGIIARTITTRIGTWTVDYDSGAEYMPWGIVSWSSYEPEDTSVSVQVRSSNDQTNWSEWETAMSGVLLSSTPGGRYLQIETTLQIVSGEDSPILYDLNVQSGISAVTYDGDTLVSTEGNPTANVNLVATLRDNEGTVLDVDGEEVTFTLTAEGIVGPIVATALSVDGVASAVEALEPAIYMIEVTLASSDATASAILVVYNPEGGFATGGGWLVPQNDGLNTHPNVRANFGFNAKYKQDSPTGHIEFRYSDGHIDLKSSSIEQLVITGGKIVQFKGWASVNKEQGHWFFVKAIDNGEPGTNNDTFDIKVWAPGVSEEGDPTERAGGVLQGGNIVVHTKE